MLTFLPNWIEKEIWAGSRHVFEQAVLLRAVIQCVLAGRDLIVYEMFSGGCKAVAELPPWGLQMYFYFAISDEVWDIKKFTDDWKKTKSPWL